MMQQSVITDEMRSVIRIEQEVGSEQVERGAIRRFVEAVENPNPLYVDEVYARKTRYGGIVAPPTFVCTIGHPNKGGEKYRRELPYKPPYAKAIRASDDWEFFEPVRLGDTITASDQIVDFYERQGREKPLLFTVREFTYRNQLGQLVARLRVITASFPD